MYLEDNCVIGSNAQVLDGAVVASNCIIAAGSIIPPGSKLHSGFYYSGSPATKTRELTQPEIASIADTANDSAELALDHSFECSKVYKQIIEDEEMYEDTMARDEEEYSRESGIDADYLNQGAPGHIFDTTLSKPERAHELEEKK